MNKKLFVLLPAVMLMLAGCNDTTNPTTPTDPTPTTDPTTDPTTPTDPVTDPTTTTDPTPVEESKIKEAYEACVAVGSGKTTSEAYTFSGVVSGKSGNSFFMQDKDYGMYCYNYGGSEKSKIEIGVYVTVTATLTNYSGLVETKSISNVVVGENVGAPEHAKVASLAELKALKQNVAIDFVVTMPASLDTWSKSAGPLVKATLGSDSVTVKFDKWAFNDDAGKAYTASAGKQLKVTGAVSSSYGSSEVTQILVTATSTLEVVE